MGRHNAMKTHCKYGHEFTESNTYVYPNGYRACRSCLRERSRGWDANNPEKKRTRAQEYYKATKEKRQTQAQEYYKANKEKIKEQSHNNYDRQRFAKYGLVSDDYTHMLEIQEGHCAICGDSPTRKLGIDHDHETGAVRGLLCNSCNLGLGKFKDSAKIIRKAAMYLDFPPISINTLSKKQISV
jgi:hypothetical protein